MSGELFYSGRNLRILLMCTAIMTLAACENGKMPGFLQSKGGSDAVSRGAVGGNVVTSERDVEAPEIFQTTEAGLWDGRPSLGGVWVAHPDVDEPERAIIRNEANGQYVIGALFRKTRETPGPRLQVSSDAAAALGLLAGQPGNLNVVALRREEGPVKESSPTPAAMPAAAEVSEGALDPMIGGAATALDAAPAAAPSPAPVQSAALDSAAPAPMPAAKPQAKPAASKLAKPYIQIGIFSVEENASNTAAAMRQVGMVPTVKTHNSQGKTFWRVVVGPAQTSDEVATLLKKIKGEGFTDAYAVTN